MGYWKQHHQSLDNIKKQKNLMLDYYKQIEACETQLRAKPCAAATINSYVQVIESLLSRRDETPLDWQEDLAMSFENLGILVQTRFGFRIRICGQDESRFIADGYISREVSETLLMLQLAEYADCFFDVGANVGYFSLLMAIAGQNDIQCYAFEPCLPVFQRLAASINDNGLQKLVQAYHYAVGDKPGMASMMLNRQGSGGNTLSQKLNSQEEDSGLSEDVQIITLDAFLDKFEIIPHRGVLKIDVEGYELKVLDGAVNYITGDSAPIILIETFPKNVFPESRDVEVLNKLKKWGYHIYRVEPFRSGYPCLKAAFQFGRLRRSAGGNYMAFPPYQREVEKSCCQPMEDSVLVSSRRLQRIMSFQQKSITEAENYFYKLAQTTPESCCLFTSWQEFANRHC